MAVPPTDWPSLRRTMEPRAREEVSTALTTDLARAERNRQSAFGRLAGNFAATDTLMMRATVVLGPEATRPVFSAWRDLFEEAVVQEDSEANPRLRSSIAAMALAGYGNLVRCTGGALPGALEDQQMETALLTRSLGDLRRLDPFERQTLALGLLALSGPDGALKALGRKSVPKFRPGAVFGPDAPGLVEHLVAAVATGASLSDVRTAWLDALAWFPRGLATRTTSWARLSWLSRIIYARVGGMSLESVAQTLSDDIASVEIGNSTLELPHSG